jgi:hypothetical protein
LCSGEGDGDEEEGEELESMANGRMLGDGLMASFLSR